MKTALLLIDIQNDYFPGGKMPLENPERAARNAYTLLQCFREHGGLHVHIQHVSKRAGATFFLPGDPGTNIHDLTAHFEGEPLIQKHYPNAFRETSLLELLRAWGVERVILCGMMTHLCVDATARAAADLGFQVLVAADACATRTLTFGDVTVPAEQVQAAFLAALQAYGQVLTVEQILTQLAAERDERISQSAKQQKRPEIHTETGKTA
ncbi:MAG: cysteine hydrolase [Anaerolineales bacterium]|nr:cysteine hydrolase [Anaerolineales bacterium]MCX7756632.1 cysteine hydrolase [Anaerolineales bacterium]MDW8277293.1 cysteine hydrolase family protein [Anaerolineales bacterium]